MAEGSCATKPLEERIRAIHRLAAKDNRVEKISNFYDEWADTFDDDAKIVGVENNLGPERCAQALAEVIKDKSALIVDCAAGTGRVGQALASLGYQNIHAVDFSQKSLDISASKGVYQKLICDELGTKKVKEIEDGYYFGLMCRGALSIGHLDGRVFPEFNRMVKRGGYLVFTIGTALFPDDPPEYLQEMLKAVDRLLKDGTWELIDKAVGHYSLGQEGYLYTVQRK